MKGQRTRKPTLRHSACHICHRHPAVVDHSALGMLLPRPVTKIGGMMTLPSTNKTQNKSLENARVFLAIIPWSELRRDRPLLQRQSRQRCSPGNYVPLQDHQDFYPGALSLPIIFQPDRGHTPHSESELEYHVSLHFYYSTQISMPRHVEPGAGSHGKALQRHDCFVRPRRDFYYTTFTGIPKRKR